MRERRRIGATMHARTQAVVTAASLSLCSSVCLSVRTRVRMHARSPEEVAAQKEATKSGEIEAPEAESKELRASA